MFGSDSSPFRNSTHTFDISVKYPTLLQSASASSNINAASRQFTNTERVGATGKLSAFLAKNPPPSVAVSQIIGRADNQAEEIASGSTAESRKDNLAAGMGFDTIVTDKAHRTIYPKARRVCVPADTQQRGKRNVQISKTIDTTCLQPKLDRYKHDRKLPSIVNSRIAKFERMTTQPCATAINTSRKEAHRQDGSLMHHQKQRTNPSELSLRKSKVGDGKARHDFGEADNSIAESCTLVGTISRHGRRRKDNISGAPVLTPSRLQSGPTMSVISKTNQVSASPAAKKAVCSTGNSEPKVISVVGHKWTSVKETPPNTSKVSIKPQPVGSKTINLKLAAYLARAGNNTDSPLQAMSIIPRGEKERSDRESSTISTMDLDTENKNAINEGTKFQKSRLKEFCNKIATGNSPDYATQESSHSSSKSNSIVLTQQETMGAPMRSRLSKALFSEEEDGHRDSKKSISDYARPTIREELKEPTQEVDQDVTLSNGLPASIQEAFTAPSNVQEIYPHGTACSQQEEPGNTQLSEILSPPVEEFINPVRQEESFSIAPKLQLLSSADEILLCHKEGEEIPSDTPKMNQCSPDCGERGHSVTMVEDHLCIEPPLQPAVTCDENQVDISVREDTKLPAQTSLIHSGISRETKGSESSTTTSLISSLVTPIPKTARLNPFEGSRIEQVLILHEFTTTIATLPTTTPIQSTGKMVEDSCEPTHTSETETLDSSLLPSKSILFLQTTTSKSETENDDIAQSATCSKKSLPTSDLSYFSSSAIDSGTTNLIDTLYADDVIFEGQNAEGSSYFVNNSLAILPETENNNYGGSDDASFFGTERLQNVDSEFDSTKCSLILKTPTELGIADSIESDTLGIRSYRSEAHTVAPSDQATDSFHSCSSINVSKRSLQDVNSNSISSESEATSLPNTPNHTFTSSSSTGWKLLSAFSTICGTKDTQSDPNTPRVSSTSTHIALRQSSRSSDCSEAILESLPSSTKSMYSGPGTPGSTASKGWDLRCDNQLQNSTQTEEDAKLEDCLESFHSCLSIETTSSAVAVLTSTKGDELPHKGLKKLGGSVIDSFQVCRELSDHEPNRAGAAKSTGNHFTVGDRTLSLHASTDTYCSSKLRTVELSRLVALTVLVESESTKASVDEDISRIEPTHSSTPPCMQDDHVTLSHGASTMSSHDTSCNRSSTDHDLNSKFGSVVHRSNLWSKWFPKKLNSVEAVSSDKSQKSDMFTGTPRHEVNGFACHSNRSIVNIYTSSDQDEEAYSESTLSQHRESSSIKTTDSLPSTPATPESSPATPRCDYNEKELKSSTKSAPDNDRFMSSQAPTEGLKDHLHSGMQALKIIFQVNPTPKSDRSSDTTTSSSVSDHEEQMLIAGCKVSTKYGLGTVVACNLKGEIFVIVKLQAGSMPMMMYCRTPHTMHVIPALRHEWVTTPAGEGCVIDYLVKDRKYLIELAVDPSTGRNPTRNAQVFSETDIHRQARVKRIPSFLTSSGSSRTRKNSLTISCNSSRGSSVQFSPLDSNDEKELAIDSAPTPSTNLFSNVVRHAMTTSNEICSSTMQYVSKRSTVGQFVVTPYGSGTITDLDHAKEVAVVKINHTDETKVVDFHAIKYTLKALVGMNVQTSNFGSGVVVAIQPENGIYTVKLTNMRAQVNQVGVIYVHENDLRKTGRYSTGLQGSKLKFWV